MITGHRSRQVVTEEQGVEEDASAHLGLFYNTDDGNARKSESRCTLQSGALKDLTRCCKAVLHLGGNDLLRVATVKRQG